MIVTDILLIFLGAIISIKAYKKICFEHNASVANYVILITYVFCIVPIIFNYIVGIPTYTSAYWYKPFIAAMQDETIGIIYDIYILSALFFLYIFESKRGRKYSKEDQKRNNMIDFLKRHKMICWMIILSPLILIISNGTLRNYAIYTTTQNRGLSEVSSNRWVTPLLLASLVIYFSVYFKDSISNRKKILSFVYFFVIAWISGKRFIFANIIILMLFYLTNMKLDINKRKKIYYVLPILAISLILLSGVYLSVIKPAKVKSDHSVYDMLRVDFGRDDVTKYVIKKEFFDKQPILEYRGETFISLFLELVPRKIWKSKPYPHYMYLTSSILNLPITNLPAGTTPSWYEMCLCNFSYFGFMIAIYLLCLFCRLLDNTNDVDIKGIGMLLLSVLLTQSMDVYFTIVIVLIMLVLLRKVKIRYTRM